MSEPALAFGCTASAFEEHRPGGLAFAPLGKAGSAYAARDPARMRALVSRVRFFCALATLIVLAWLVLLGWQRLDYDPARWRFGYALGVAFAAWTLAYSGWAWSATRGLEKVRG